MLEKNIPVLSFQDIDRSKINLVGGKGANLGELYMMQDVHVPNGFCVTTAIFREIISNHQLAGGLLIQLSQLKIDDRKSISKLSVELRNIIEMVTIPPDTVDQISQALSHLGEHKAYAVRSSATAEDLPAASFAGQQDSFLNIRGKDSILKHIAKCWASLYTERAIIYRIQNGFDHGDVNIAVVIQLMIFPQVAGVMFTADPVTSNRKTISIDASFGLGEALVTGIVNPDNYSVRGDTIMAKNIAEKNLAIYASSNGGTVTKEIEQDQQLNQALSDDQILFLAQLGKKVEQHFAAPQDIEWCLADNNFYIVQSRPITTLFPIPAFLSGSHGSMNSGTGSEDAVTRVYISVGHNQMMTDAMKPLGLSFFLMVTNAPMRVAGGRLFVDVTNQLSSVGSRKIIIETFGQSDPWIKDALIAVSSREDIFPLFAGEKFNPASEASHATPFPDVFEAQIENNTSIVDELIINSEQSIAALAYNIATKSGEELLDFILNDIQELKKILFDPQSFAVFMTAMNASSWINVKMNEWLGEKGVADQLTQSVPNNITSEMGLALLDIADVIRQYPEVIHYLETVKDHQFLEGLLNIAGGKETRDVIYSYLNKYGMRCAGEIDITKTRWAENPAMLIPIILSNIKNFQAGERLRKFEEGRLAAFKKEQELLNRLSQLTDGNRKAKETKRVISFLRNFIGYREYPKYAKISRYYFYKKALLKESDKVWQAGVIQHEHDIYFLSFEELREVIRTQKLDENIIVHRKEEYKLFEKLTPPRVITSDGEIIAGHYQRGNLPANAILGLAVSSGVIEGRARVMVNMEDAQLETGDILVTTYTDPSWTPLFVSIKGLVTEVGGLMTHGSVIAREYGLPAVVGVENATKLIRDGQSIRVHGTDGYVEILE